MNSDIQLLIFCIVMVFGLVTSLEFFIYTLKRAPKSSSFSQRTWYFGWLCLAISLYFYFNGMKFI